jgi:hypothetical protein
VATVQWRVQICGDPHDLTNLPDLLRSPDFSVIQHGDQYFLSSRCFDAVAEAEEVLRQGGQMLRQLGGALRLLHEAGASLTTGRVV